MQQQEVRLVGPGSNASRLRVCDDCGAQLNILDHETRIADHFNGKMHLGMVEVRERYNQMKVGSKISYFFVCSIFLMCLNPE